MPAALNRVIRSYEGQFAIGPLNIPNDRAAVFLGSFLFPPSRGLQPARSTNCLEPPDGVYRLRAPAHAIIAPWTTSRSRHSPRNVSNGSVFARQPKNSAKRTHRREPLSDCSDRAHHAVAPNACTLRTIAQAEACGSGGGGHRASRTRARRRQTGIGTITSKRESF